MFNVQTCSIAHHDLILSNKFSFIHQIMNVKCDMVCSSRIWVPARVIGKFRSSSNHGSHSWWILSRKKSIRKWRWALKWWIKSIVTLLHQMTNTTTQLALRFIEILIILNTIEASTTSTTSSSKFFESTTTRTSYTRRIIETTKIALNREKPYSK